jgi:transcriptional antiterminator
MEFKLDSNLIESLIEYSKLIDKEPSIILKEALEDYFAKIEKEFLEKSMEESSALTTFNYDEFFDGLDIDD